MSRHGQAVESYQLTVEVAGGLPSMAWLVDTVGDALERQLHLSPDGDYCIEVHGPPELRIRMVERSTG